MDEIDAVNGAGQHPIVKNPTTETRDHLKQLGTWPSLPAPPAPPVLDDQDASSSPSTDSLLAGDTQSSPVELTRIFLGGGGWRGAFGSIGAVMYLHDRDEWKHVIDVVAISGGSFVAGALGSAEKDDDPAPVLCDLIGRLLPLDRQIKRRLAAPVIFLPLIVIPGAFALATRAVLSRLWMGVLKRAFPDQPATTSRRRYLIAATGRESALAYSFVLGDMGRPDPVASVLVPGKWTVGDAILASTALPWINGYSLAESIDQRTNGPKGGEYLIDGGLLGIFGTHLFDPQPKMTSPGDDQKILIVDAGRATRRGGWWMERITSLSTTALLAKWLQVSLHASLLGAVARASTASGGEPWIRLVRVAERDEMDNIELLAPWDADFNRLEHGRRVVMKFGLTNLTPRNAYTTIVVSVAACTFEFEGGLGNVRQRLGCIGGALRVPPEFDLVTIWDEL